jgi:hypothetical protein
MNALLKLAEEAKKAVETPTFSLASIETQVFKTGTTGFRATLSDGTKVTFNEKTLDRVVEEVDKDTWRLKPGTTISNDLDRGLIPSGSQRVSLWK